METKQKLGLGGALVLPILAGAFMVATPAHLGAEENCVYAGLEYSVGACVQSVCPPQQGQMCQPTTGSWTQCTEACAPPL